MHVLELPLKTTKYDNYLLNRRFHAISHIHNVCVKYMKKRLGKLKFDKDYQTYLQEYLVLKDKKTLKSIDKKRKNELSNLMKDIRISYGISKSALHSYIKVCGKQYKNLISSQQVQKEVTRVCNGVDKVLFSNGKDIHYKRFNDFNTIGQTSNLNGIKFDKATLSIVWNKQEISCKHIDKILKSQYEMESLDNKISYCEIKRRMFNNGWHYYLLIYLDGDAPRKLHNVGSETMGIDPGVSTVACVSDTKVILHELAPNAKHYEKKIAKLQQSLEVSKRISNPNKYNEDGTYKKNNKDKWKFSNSYYKKRRQLKTLYRKKSEYTSHSHNKMINEMLSDSCNFIIESMNFKALAKRSKKTERKSDITEIQCKDGSKKSIHKYKRKKRFGKSIGSRSPSLFMHRLEVKAIRYGGIVKYVDTMTMKASQYHHDTDEYVKTSLKERYKVINNNEVQRDLYSAFLIKNADMNLQYVDRSKCIYGFDNFVRMHNELIARMKQQGITMKQCFGF